MDKIYTIMMATELKLDEQSHFPNFGHTRVVGWYESLERAEQAVVSNEGDIWETCYTYAIIEEIEEGLYNTSMNRRIYKYNVDEDKYEPIDEPEWLSHYFGFGIG